MAADIFQGFRPLTQEPIDNRFTAATIADRNAMPSAVLYDGLTVWVQSELTSFILTNRNAPNDNDSWLDASQAGADGMDGGQGPQGIFSISIFQVGTSIPVSPADTTDYDITTGTFTVPTGWSLIPQTLTTGENLYEVRASVNPANADTTRLDWGVVFEAGESGPPGQRGLDGPGYRGAYNAATNILTLTGINGNSDITIEDIVGADGSSITLVSSMVDPTTMDTTVTLSDGSTFTVARGATGAGQTGPQGPQGIISYSAFQNSATAITAVPTPTDFTIATSTPVIPTGYTATPSTPGAGEDTYETRATLNPSAFTDGQVTAQLVWSAPFRAGSTGPQGPSGTIAIGTVTSVAAGTTPTITNRGTANAAILDFMLTVGNTGSAGTNGFSVALTPARNVNNNGTLITRTSTDPSVANTTFEVLDGSRIRTGVGAPANTLGVVGDLYIDLANSMMYGVKTTNSISPWGSGVSFRGATGQDGDDVSVSVLTNTATDYRLRIITTPGDGSAATTVDTPNLRGTDGETYDDLNEINPAAADITDFTRSFTFSGALSRTGFTIGTNNPSNFQLEADQYEIYATDEGAITPVNVSNINPAGLVTSSSPITFAAVGTHTLSIRRRTASPEVQLASTYGKTTTNDLEVNGILTLGIDSSTTTTTGQAIGVNTDGEVVTIQGGSTTQVTASEVGVGFKATSFTTLLADAVNIKAPGTIAAVSDAVLFNRSTALPRSSAVEANVNSIPFTYVATNNNGSYSLAFPQQPVAVPLAVGDTASFFVIPDGSGLTVGHHTVLVEGQQITSSSISFGGSSASIAATLPLTSAQFAAIKATDGVESQVFQGGEALGIPNRQIFLFEASTVPTHTISTFYVYRGTTQVTTATLADDWLDSDIATDIAGISDAQSAQLLAAPKRFNPLATYTIGDQIFFNDKVYAAIVGLTPAPFNIVNWEVLGTGSGGGTGLTPTQELILTNTVAPFAQTSSYAIGDQIIRNGDLLVANANKTSGTAFIAANWAPASSQNLRTIVELHEVRPTEGPLTVIFTLGTETSFGYTSPSADFQLNPTDYQLITVDGTALTVAIAVTNRAQNGVVTIASAIPGLAAGSHTLTFLKRTEESFVEVTAAVTEVDGDIHFLGNRFLAPNIPTTDPQIANVDWYDGGVRTRSGSRAAYNQTTHFGLTVNGPGTDIFNVFVAGMRRRNINVANSDVLFDLEDNFGNRMIAFLTGLIAYEGTDIPAGSTDENTTGEITLPSTTTTPTTVVTRTTLQIQFSNTYFSMDGKTATIEENMDGSFTLAVSGIDDNNDLHIPPTSGPGTISLLRSINDIESLLGHGAVSSNDGTITNEITKGRWDLTVTNPAVITSDTVATSQATTGNGSASISGGALTVVFPPSSTSTNTGTNAATADALNVTTYTGTSNPLVVNATTPTNRIEVTESQLTFIKANPALIDVTADYWVQPDPVTQAAALPEPEPLQAFAISFIPGFNSPVNVSTTTSDVTITDDTVEIDLVFAVDNPGSTSNNIPTIQVPIIANDGTTIPRPSSSRVAFVYELDGVAQALGARATIGTDGAIVLTGAFGADTSWNAIGTQTVTINIQYPNN